MSNTQKKNVPELRFPGFEGEWEEKARGSYKKLILEKIINIWIKAIYQSMVLAVI